jgi:7,8-dihydropterin-6-yl-methyl-4-(beta-D-ribofuranosyl)aminobenzene 5'-phosphate synthase
MKIITLLDNITYKKKLKGEHGLSFLIKTDDGLLILFDTGQSNQFIENAQILGEDLKNVDAVVISHGHYDHTGGLNAFLQLNTKAVVWMKKGALSPKFSIATGELSPIGVPPLAKQHLSRIRFLDNDTTIYPGVVVLANIPMVTSFETVNPKLLVHRDNQYQPDHFPDELMLYVINQQKAVAISGCAHRGIINTLKAVTVHSGIDHFSLVTGGTHLNGCADHRLQATINELNRMKIDRLMPNHCTGTEAYCQMRTSLHTQVSYAQTGTVVTL